MLLAAQHLAQRNTVDGIRTTCGIPRPSGETQAGREGS